MTFGEACILVDLPGRDEAVILGELNRAFNPDNEDLPGDWRENLRLIAAAPQMHQALKKVVKSGHTDTCDAALGEYDCTCGWQDAQDALAAARKDTK